MDTHGCFRQLACAVLLGAVQDWKGYGMCTETQNNHRIPIFNVVNFYGFESPREELLEFFNSAWCAELCACVDLSYSEVLRKLEVRE